MHQLAKKLSAVMMLTLVGCSSQPGHSHLMPSESKARTALTAALDAWREGKKIGKISTSAAAVEPIDVKWQAGQQLEGYEILEMKESGNGPTVFKVRLKMKAPAATVETSYYVLGADPLWVYREEDYRKLGG